MTIMTITRIHRNNTIITLRLFLAVVVLLIITPHHIIASTTTTSLPPTTTTTKTPITAADDNDEIITTSTPNDDNTFTPQLSPREEHVLRTLHARYESVMNGDRLGLFSLRYRRHSDKIDLDLEDEENERKTSTAMSLATSLLPTILNKIGYRSDLENRGLYPSEGLSLAFPPYDDDEDDDNLAILSSSSSSTTSTSHDASLLSPPSTWRLIGRTIVLGWNFAPCIATVGLAFLSKRFREGVWFDLISWGMARSGPAFIKWGQWASTRSDMFPEKLCLALSHLHNDAPAHSFTHTQNLLSQTLHIPPSSLPSIFSSISPRPIASGSIAQIHTATLHSLSSSSSSPTQDADHRIVALKIIHPHVSHLLDLDFRLMSHLANILNSIPSLKWIDLRSTVDQFCHSMSTQCRLDVEAHHLEVLNYNFRRWRSVGFPRPMVASEEGVIVETFEEGEVVTKIMDYYETSSPLGRVPLPIAKFCVTRGVGLYMKMLLVDNVMHSDLHPGNIMLSGIPIGNNQKEIKNKTHRVTLVDAGMVATLSRIEAINFIGLLVAIGDGNACAAVTSLLRFSPLNAKHLSPHDRLLLSRAMSQFFRRHCRGYHTSVDVGVVLRGLLGLIRDYRVRIDANYATLFVNMLCIEGMARRVCPEYNVLDASRPLLVGYKAVCGDEGVCHVSQTRRNILKIFAPFLYLYKKRLDNQFFGRLQQSVVGDAGTDNTNDDDNDNSSLIRQLQQGRTALKHQRAKLVTTAAVIIATTAAIIGGNGDGVDVFQFLKDRVKFLTDREWNVKMISPSSVMPLVRRQLGGVTMMKKIITNGDDVEDEDDEQ